MTKAQHTPGPWNNRYGKEITAQITGMETVIVEVNSCGPADISNKERKCNAALIAAAPELLDALVNAANVLAALAIGDLHTIEPTSPALLRARAAIAKARGE